ncbi:hypothetical protein SODALDRAFT_141401 [Sodiomyces alkalinus F11]|uniref:Uncharacterized protein n=1 Tax=Sodiomyces alkalinus (strain CBS 110278 / VKM F-3762 / F11) TaxID=1314773 RepID=A0A3N2PZL3_SODAK|nr:hypothetical protein SODALDRAFT_141401 [Sodiomyces alkalinus F11]ROT39922.1 hypothetical protein SODALDRAFT_141401 [Sodiomyces alkalinus F11]
MCQLPPGKEKEPSLKLDRHPGRETSDGLVGGPPQPRSDAICFRGRGAGRIQNDQQNSHLSLLLFIGPWKNRRNRPGKLTKPCFACIMLWSPYQPADFFKETKKPQKQKCSVSPTWSWHAEGGAAFARSMVRFIGLGLASFQRPAMKSPGAPTILTSYLRKLSSPNYQACLIVGSEVGLARSWSCRPGTRRG